MGEPECACNPVGHSIAQAQREQGNAKERTAPIVGRRGSRESDVAGQPAEGALVKALLGEDLGEDAADVFQRFLVSHDRFDAFEPNILCVGAYRMNAR